MALLAGFQKSKGELIISIDSDLQDFPEDIPKLIDHMFKDNSDVVCGWRSQRKDTLSKRFT